MVSVKVFPAFHGDALLIEFGSDTTRKVLVDTGPGKMYSRGNWHRHILPSAPFDLVILTHVDEDHIGGILKYYEDPDAVQCLFRSVWFNSGSIVAPTAGLSADVGREVALVPRGQLLLSIQDAKSLEACLIKEGNWDQQLYIAGRSVVWEEAVFTFLSPLPQTLQALSKEWSLVEEDNLYMAGSTDYSRSISELVQCPFKESGSLQNKASIAFLFEYKGVRLLLLGDAFPSVVAQSLQALGYSLSHPLRVDLVKLSHHGSRYALSPQLLNLISCREYVISTDGSKGHPNKEALARIIKAYSPGVTLHFNYSNEKIQRIFFSEEPQKYNFRISYLDQLREPYTISFRASP